MKPLGKVKIEWSPEFAYAIGLITTDGCLSSNYKTIELTSNDEEQLLNFKKCLGIDNKIGFKTSGYDGGISMRIQLGDVLLFDFLLKIGLTPHKSKTVGGLAIPDEHFFDFLRGCFDGDGTFYSYWDKRWASSFMFYTEFISASVNHIHWLRERLETKIGISGHITKSLNNSALQLKYAKAESLQLLPKLYYNRDVVCLSRKRLKIEKALAVEGYALTK